MKKEVMIIVPILIIISVALSMNNAYHEMVFTGVGEGFTDFVKYIVHGISNSFYIDFIS
ncbi:hypothetical protein [Gottfriedia acidiceleris]|uniref:hypothetical protein n=1 Tax=Gottfriedia acidiceleris TaxID=371036 RepID=UPI002FFD8FDA